MAGSASASKEDQDLKWIRDEFSKRVTKELLQAELKAINVRIDAIEKGDDDTKNIALSAKRKAEMEHECMQKGIIESIKGEVSGWTKWFRVGLVSLIGAIVAIGGTALWRFVVLSSNVEITQTSLDRVESNVKGLEESQKSLTQAVNDLKKQDDARSQAQLGEIRTAVSDAVRQAMKEERRPR